MSKSVSSSVKPYLFNGLSTKQIWIYWRTFCKRGAIVDIECEEISLRKWNGNFLVFFFFERTSLFSFLWIDCLSGLVRETTWVGHTTRWKPVQSLVLQSTLPQGGSFLSIMCSVHVTSNTLRLAWLLFFR